MSGEHKCEGCYKRNGELVSQFLVDVLPERWVFRYYLCRWCRGLWNRRKASSGTDWKRTAVVAWKPDEEVTVND